MGHVKSAQLLHSFTLSNSWTYSGSMFVMRTSESFIRTADGGRICLMVFLQYAAVRQLFFHAFLLHQRHLWPHQLHSYTHRLAEREHLCQVVSATALQI